eukprot:gene2634-5007_t
MQPAVLPEAHQNPQFNHQHKTWALCLTSNGGTLCSQRHCQQHIRTPSLATSRKPGPYAQHVMALRYAASSTASSAEANTVQPSVARKEVTICITKNGPLPSFLPIDRPKLQLEAIFKPLTVRQTNGTEVNLTLVQVLKQTFSDVEDNQLRMVEMCNNHPMYQFLFDETGKLLAANTRAIVNMREHLGSCEMYTLRMYLSMGESTGGLGPDQMYHEAMDAIFKFNEPCHRFPQLRWSKRHPGKFRWVLYEMWPLIDPITQKKAMLLCEQNISQVCACVGLGVWA